MLLERREYPEVAFRSNTAVLKSRMTCMTSLARFESR